LKYLPTLLPLLVSDMKEGNCRILDIVHSAIQDGPHIAMYIKKYFINLKNIKLLIPIQMS